MRELGAVSLLDALDYVGLLAVQRPDRFDRAAIRWHGRLDTEAVTLTLAESQLDSPRSAACGVAIEKLSLSCNAYCVCLDSTSGLAVESRLRREGRRGMAELAEQHAAKAKGRSAREGVSRRPTRRILLVLTVASGLRASLLGCRGMRSWAWLSLHGSLGFCLSSRSCSPLRAHSTTVLVS